MKKRVRWILLLPLLLFFFSLPVAAVEEKELFADFFAALPPAVQDELAGMTAPEDAADLIGAEQLLTMVVDSLRGELTASLPYLARLLGLALLLAALSHLAEGFGEGEGLRAAECGIRIVLVLALYHLAAEDVARTVTVLTDMRRFSDGLLPVFAALLAGGGSTGTAVASSGGFAAMSYLLEHAAAGVLLPLLRVLFAFALVMAAGGRRQLGGIAATVKQLYLTVLGFLMLLLTASLGFQSTLAASADSLAAHSIRFAVGNLIPVVGGSLGGTLRTLGASLSLLKSTVGALAVAALLLFTLPALISLLLHRFLISLAASLSSMLGSERAAQAFGEFRGIYDLAAATLAMCLVLFLLIVSILARCGLAIGAVGG